MGQGQSSPERRSLDRLNKIEADLQQKGKAYNIMDALADKAMINGMIMATESSDVSKRCFAVSAMITNRTNMNKDLSILERIGVTPTFSKV